MTKRIKYKYYKSLMGNEVIIFKVYSNGNWIWYSKTRGWTQSTTYPKFKQYRSCYSEHTLIPITEEEVVLECL